MKHSQNFLLALAALLFSITIITPALAQAPKEATIAEGLNFLSAAIAFGMGAIGAGWAIGRAGSAGLAASADRPELRVWAVIIAALGEALGIYGIVIAFQILAKA